MRQETTRSSASKGAISLAGNPSQVILYERNTTYPALRDVACRYTEDVHGPPTQPALLQVRDMGAAACGLVRGASLLTY